MNAETQRRRENINDLSSEVIGAAIEVHQALGPGLLESVYELALCHELALREVCYERQKPLPLIYKGRSIEPDYRLDLLIENQLVVELKAIDKLAALHEVQVLTYLRLSGMKLGLLINFNVPILVQGVRRIANKL
ncbi:MAG: GxxExxY protein [Thiobacillus sp.]